MQKILTTTGEYVLVDLDVYELYSKYLWRVCSKSGKIRTSSYVNGKREVFLDSLVLNLDSRLTGRAVKYLDGNYLNVTRENITTSNVVDLIEDGDVLTVLLDNGKSFIVDSDLKNLILKYRWDINKVGYVVFSRNGKRKTLHREILMDKLDGDILVDHINGDKTDNRKCNLRICNKSQNGANRGKDRFGSRSYNSKYKGLTLNKSGSWTVRVGRKRIGTYSTEIAAANAYNISAKEIYGEFAFLNDVPYMHEHEVDKLRTSIQKTERDDDIWQKRRRAI